MINYSISLEIILVFYMTNTSKPGIWLGNAIASRLQNIITKFVK